MFKPRKSTTQIRERLAGCTSPMSKGLRSPTANTASILAAPVPPSTIILNQQVATYFDKTKNFLQELLQNAVFSDVLEFIEKMQDYLDTFKDIQCSVQFDANPSAKPARRSSSLKYFLRSPTVNKHTGRDSITVQESICPLNRFDDIKPPCDDFKQGSMTIDLEPLRDPRKSAMLLPMSPVLSEMSRTASILKRNTSQGPAEKNIPNVSASIMNPPSYSKPTEASKAQAAAPKENAKGSQNRKPSVKPGKPANPAGHVALSSSAKKEPVVPGSMTPRQPLGEVGITTNEQTPNHSQFGSTKKPKTEAKRRPSINTIKVVEFAPFNVGKSMTLSESKRGTVQPTDKPPQVEASCIIAAENTIDGAVSLFDK